MVTKINKWFTLIELLVWISISILLMLSIWYLISWWIKNIVFQEKILQNSSDFSSFQNNLSTIFQNIDTNFEPIKTNSWVIVKINQNYDQWGFAYIWETSQNELYCLSWSEKTSTKHIFIKTFIPWFDIDKQKSHKIDWIGKWIFWGSNPNSPEGEELDKIYLNNPTWSANSWSIDFISDTLNNRVLYKSGSKVYQLLNREDWLSEPTDLYYNNWELYITNSGKWEILKYSSKSISNPSLTLIWITANNISSFKISFYDNNWNFNITDKWNINIENHTIALWDNYSNSWNELNFSFSWWTDKNFSDEKITISNLTDFTGTGSYFVKLDINNKFYKFFTQWDDNLLTKDDNTLEIIEKDSTKYYTKINSIWNYESYSPNSSTIINYNKKYDYILKNPIEWLNINYDTTEKLLNFELNYYNKYNCYNLDEKSNRKFILKKNYKTP